MTFRLSLLTASLAGLCLALPATACLWDYDTLNQEQSRFPSTIELITGKFLRHSPKFYQWRIEDRLQKLAKNPEDIALYDDLGVAYQKTGQHEKALETMSAKDKLRPALYETKANLGTFYILSGDLKQGLPFIDEALKIKPHAHFDRERYQKWLVEYALSKYPDGKLNFPLCKTETGPRFPEFLAVKLSGQPGFLSQEASQKAVQAVLGMMRFADYDNPLLLEVLGDLLIASGMPEDGKQLSARAYLAASYKFKGQPEEKEYRVLAEKALHNQARRGDDEQMPLAALEEEFRKERAEAEAWYRNLEHKESLWIEKGLNADSEFDKLYHSEPRLSETVDTFGLTLSGLGLMVIFSSFAFWKAYRRAEKKGSNT